MKNNLKLFKIFVSFLGVIAIAIGFLHLVMGPNADVLLGAVLPIDTLGDPVLDSQNRFYGMIFAAYGTLVLLCASDPFKYEIIFFILVIFLFAGGIARLVSILQTGIPTILVITLTILELVLAPCLFLWYRTIRGLKEFL